MKRGGTEDAKKCCKKLNIATTVAVETYDGRNVYYKVVPNMTLRQLKREISTESGEYFDRITLYDSASDTIGDDNAMVDADTVYTEALSPDMEWTFTNYLERTINLPPHIRHNKSARRSWPDTWLWRAHVAKVFPNYTPSHIVCGAVANGIGGWEPSIRDHDPLYDPFWEAEFRTSPPFKTDEYKRFSFKLNTIDSSDAFTEIKLALVFSVEEGEEESVDLCIYSEAHGNFKEDTVVTICIDPSFCEGSVAAMSTPVDVRVYFDGILPVDDNVWAYKNLNDNRAATRMVYATDVCVSVCLESGVKATLVDTPVEFCNTCV